MKKPTYVNDSTGAIALSIQQAKLVLDTQFPNWEKSNPSLLGSVLIAMTLHEGGLLPKI